jgi:hypothetical protein
MSAQNLARVVLGAAFAVATFGTLEPASLAFAQNPSPQVTPPAPATVPSQNFPAQVLPETPAAPPIPQYQVEVLIFAHRDFDRSEEQFEHENGRSLPLRPEELRAPPVFDDTNFGPLAQNPPPAGQPGPLGAGAPGAGELDADGLPPAGDPFAAEQTEFRFRLLRPEELQLTSQYRILERNPQAYTPLLHGGWVQPGLPESDARPFDLAMLGATNPVGSIRLYLSRFLHVDLDVSYQDVVGAVPATPPALTNELAEVPIAPRYHLTADRTTRSGELHYFDHPAFGVLVKVTPVRVEQAQPGTPGTRPAA